MIVRGLGLTSVEEQELGINPDDRYLHADLFSGDRDTYLRGQQVKMVHTRADHLCASPIGRQHVIPAGTRCRYEKAMVDEDGWHGYWTCTSCVDGWIKEYENYG